MRYEIGKTYRTRVEAPDVFCSIHFKFFSDKCVLVKDVYDGEWSSYSLASSVEIHHGAPDGTWILRVDVGSQLDWLFRRDGILYVPAIYEVKEQELEGKHYDAIIDDDMDDVMQEVMQAVHKRDRTSIFKNVTEGGNEMKQLFHVILFNRRTEEIDFKAYISATDEIEAGMTAAHNYDKYDGKIHMHIVKHISSYETIK